MTTGIFNIDPDGPVALEGETAAGGSVNSCHAVACEHCGYCDDGGSTP